ncbi:predicted protein [Botrytis cinerea T4]|uniref:Uncharacterized protein n=1 Tax=Botryotinia fuckeliana (strain T4) TaxID=999810 RepID=G2XPD6_BOTF4|nr:predicted protein [Botrytis cinerea T4]
MYEFSYQELYPSSKNNQAPSSLQQDHLLQTFMSRSQYALVIYNEDFKFERKMWPLRTDVASGMN